MKRILTWLTIIFLIIIIGCNSKQSNPESYEDYPLEVTDDYKRVKVWKRFDRSSFGNLYDYYLKEPKIIQSVPCKGRFTIDGNGELYGFTLSEDYNFHDNVIPAGSSYQGRIYNNQRNGYMIYLSKDAEIQGYYIRSKGKGIEDYKVDFYHNNKLRSFKLVNDTEIDGIPCKGGKNDYVILYPDGKLGQCTLSRTININNKTFPEETTIMIGKNGEIYDENEATIKIDFFMDIED